MALIPIYDDIQKTIEGAVENGVSDTAVISGCILNHHSDPPSPDEIEEQIATVKSQYSEPNSTDDDVEDGSISDEELREALQQAGVSGENAGEMPS